MPQFPNGPSEHLSWVELACHDGTEYPQKWRSDRAIELSQAFERIRKICGFPLSINSGYRTFNYNLSIGGAALSQHVEGRALDLCPPKSIRNGLQKLREAAGQARREGLIRGIGLYDGFVHVDTRPGQNKTWSGPRKPIEV